MALCMCGEEYSDKRKELGYNTCLECGEKEARLEISNKARSTAPAYNKGPHMYITKRWVKDVGKK